MYAANLGLLDNVKKLVSLGADPALQNVGGDTASSMAERSGHKAVVEYLKSLPAKKNDGPGKDTEQKKP